MVFNLRVRIARVTANRFRAATRTQTVAYKVFMKLIANEFAEKHDCIDLAS